MQEVMGPLPGTEKRVSLDVRLREEVDWGGSINMLAGWQWMSDSNTGTLRTGLQFFNGKSMQYQFFQEDNQMVGFGVWYDY